MMLSEGLTPSTSVTVFGGREHHRNRGKDLGRGLGVFWKTRCGNKTEGLEAGAGFKNIGIQF
jgi:hypothetical protein